MTSAIRITNSSNLTDAFVYEIARIQIYLFEDSRTMIT